MLRGSGAVDMLLSERPETEANRPTRFLGATRVLGHSDSCTSTQRDNSCQYDIQCLQKFDLLPFYILQVCAKQHESVSNETRLQRLQVAERLV